jgi:putative transposase
VLRAIIRRIWTEHRQVYGPRKVWRQMGRENLYAARCRVRRLMREMGLSGAVRGRAWTTTTHAAGDVDPPCDLVDRHFTAMRGGGFASHVRFTELVPLSGSARVVSALHASSGCQTSPTWRPGAASSTSRLSLTCLLRRIVGWRVSSSLVTDFVLDALEQAIYDRCGDAIDGLIHYSDRGTQYLSMWYTDRLADAGIAPSVGSRGDSYDNALAESIIGLFKTEVIRRLGPWLHVEAVEFATLDWVDWFNTRRLFEPIGYVPPAEYEARYYEQAAVA